VLGSINAQQSTAFYYVYYDIYMNCWNLQRLCCFCCCCSGFIQPQALLLKQLKLHLAYSKVTESVTYGKLCKKKKGGAGSSLWRGDATRFCMWWGPNLPSQILRAKTKGDQLLTQGNGPAITTQCLIVLYQLSDFHLKFTVLRSFL